MSDTRIVCLGDSLTQGFDVSVESRWTTLLQDALKVEIINCGINGDTTSGMLARLPLILKEHQPTHLLILGGTNDLWFGLPNTHIIANIHAIIRQTTYNNVRAIVGIPTSIIHNHIQNIVKENYSDRMSQFQKDLKKYCLSDDQVYIPFQEHMRQYHFLEDGLHSNKEGQVSMKEQALNILERML